MAKTRIEIRGGGILQDALERTAETFRQRIDEAVKSAITHPDLTARELEIFKSLTGDWVRPMDIGGRDRSDHSRVLSQLVRKGLVERKGYGSYRYRNPNYVAPPPVKTRFDRMLEFTRILAGYGCAGIDQEPDDTTCCGKCGPCEANAFLRTFGKKQS